MVPCGWICPWTWYLLVEGLGVNERSEGMESKQGGESKVRWFCLVALMCWTPGLSVSPKGGTSTSVIPSCPSTLLSKPCCSGALQHPSNLEQCSAAALLTAQGLASLFPYCGCCRSCLPALARGADRPFLGCSTFRCI